MRVHKALTRIGSAVEAAKDFGLVAIMPALLPFFAFHVAVRFLPLWGQVVVSMILFAVLLAALWYITGERLERAIRAHHETRVLVWFPLAASIGTLVFAMHVFAAAQSILIAVGLATLTPEVPQTEWSRITDLYLWYFLSSVPGFKIPETLKWSSPYQYSDHITGVFILSFQVVVIAPVIKVFYTWSKVRKELLGAAQKTNA